MNKSTVSVPSLVDKLLEYLQAHPEKDLRRTWLAMREGKYCECVPLQILRQPTFEERERWENCGLSFEERLRGNLEYILWHSRFENPVAPSLEVGFGVGTMATIFGAELDFENNAYPDMPKEHISLNQFEHFCLSEGIEKAGLMPLIREQIDFYKEHTPADFLISLPNIQGPFNIAHTLVGSEIFIAMEEHPEQVHRLMQLVTDVLIEVIPLFEKWIGDERLSPTPGFSYCIASVESRCFIAECSCNLISSDYYREFVLPYDRQLDAHFGPLAIHPCSGRHVFDVTLESFPDLRYTEAGWIECDPNSKSVEEAVKDIGDRPIILYVREELRKGKELERIKELINIAKVRGRMYISVTGMYWTVEDDEYIVELHRETETYFRS